MRLTAALLLCVCLLCLLAQAARRCRKKNGSKKCDKSAVGPPRWRRRGKETALVERVLATAVFKCQVRANPRPKYRWYKNGKLIQTQKSKKYRRKKYRLMINSLQLSDSGHYSCNVYNTHGNLTRNFTLTVLGYHPVVTEFSIKERPQNQTAQVGDSIVFRCSTDSFPPPTIEWSMRRRDKPDMDILLQKASNRAKAEMYLLDHVTKEHAGSYTCTMKNKNTTRRLSAELVVINEGEELPFEPKCALHVRKQVLYDDTYGCHTVEAVKLTYCMGSCGRSSYVPTLVSADSSPANSSTHLASASTPGHANQTCQCCVGLIQGLQVVSLQCPSGESVNSFFTTLRGCVCRDCNVEDDMKQSNAQTSGAP